MKDSVENDEIILFYVTPRGLKESTTWTMRGGGKRGDVRTSETVAKSFQQQVAKEILAATSTKLPMILCGPGHARVQPRTYTVDLISSRPAKDQWVGKQGCQTEIVYRYDLVELRSDQDFGFLLTVGRAKLDCTLATPGRRIRR